MAIISALQHWETFRAKHVSSEPSEAEFALAHRFSGGNQKSREARSALPKAQFLSLSTKMDPRSPTLNMSKKNAPSSGACAGSSFINHHREALRATASDLRPSTSDSSYCTNSSRERICEAR